MKLMISMLILVLAVVANAATVKSASYDERTDELVIMLRYGGCRLETFAAKWGACAESYPAQISVTLDDSQDRCKAIASGTVRIPVPQDCRPAYVAVTTQRSGRRGGLSVYVPPVPK